MTDDLRYEPPRHGLDWLARLNPASCLVIGAPPAEHRGALSRIAAEIREAPPGPVVRLLHEGAYAMLRTGEWQAVVVVSGGKPPVAAASARARYAEDGHLTHAPIVRDQLWPIAQPFAGEAKFPVGAMVRAKGSGAIGRVRGVLAAGGSYQYEVDVQGEVRRYSEDSLMLVEGDPRDPAFWLAQRPAGARDLALTLTWLKLRHPLTDTLYSFASSKTVFRPYQFKPVLKLLTASSGRLLIADEVGLGKTIEAGLIWNELEQRNPLQRVLVVAPAVLTTKWQMEMARRFDRTLAVIRPSDLARFVARLENGEEPPLHGVISLESLRGATAVLERLDEFQPRLDLVIVDEAHYLRNRESKSHQLGTRLASWADHLIFLSATPLNLGNNDLFNLVNLLDEGNFIDRRVFAAQLKPNQILNGISRALMTEERQEPRKLATRLEDLHALEYGATVTDRPDYAQLRTLLDVDRPLDAEETARARRLLAALNVLGGVLTRTRKADVPDRKAVREPRNIHVTWTEEERDYYSAIQQWYKARARKLGTPPGFVMQMPLRQAASCIPASQQLFGERNHTSVLFEVDDVDEDVEPEVAELASLSVPTAPLAVDSKYERLLDELLELRRLGLRQIMIFSFFRRTLSYLARRLGERFSVRVMDGGVPSTDREQIMRDFRDGGFEILLLSEVGSEGLDFEFCNVLVNYDLPWNPMRVEQRIGRLDRFGQENEKIFIYNMHVPGTIETDIFQRLYERIGVFEGSIGELEPILRDELNDITKRLLDPHLDEVGRQRELDRISVALQQRAQEVDLLRESQAQLTGLDGYLVEGFTESGPDRGRFIGAAEIERMLDELFHRYGGRRRRPDGKGIFSISGTRELADRLRTSKVGEGGSKHTRHKLAGLLQNGDLLKCTLRPEAASRYDVELLSARHPLVKLALEVLDEEALALPRFGTLAVPGVPPGKRYLVTIDLAHTTGLRPLLELWATAIDVETGELGPEVDDALLTALAAGDLRDGSEILPDGLHDLWRRAQERASLRQHETERLRAQDNAALVEGRIRVSEGALDNQLRTAERLLREATFENKSLSIRRLHEGRLRNLRTRRDAIRAELSGRKQLDISLTAVAVALIEAAPTPSRDTTG